MYINIKSVRRLRGDKKVYTIVNKEPDGTFRHGIIGGDSYCSGRTHIDKGTEKMIGLYLNSHPDIKQYGEHFFIRKKDAKEILQRIIKYEYCPTFYNKELTIVITCLIKKGTKVIFGTDNFCRAEIVISPLFDILYYPLKPIKNRRDGDFTTSYYY